LDPNGERDSAVFALNSIYESLGERDHLFGLKQVLTSEQDIKEALIHL